MFDIESEDLMKDAKNWGISGVEKVDKGIRIRGKTFYGYYKALRRLWGLYLDR